MLEELPDGSSALVLAIEHLWAIPLRDAVRDAGGVVLAARSLTPEKMVVLGMLVAAVDEAVDEIEAAEADAEAEGPVLEERSTMHEVTVDHGRRTRAR